ncbi:MAG: DUF885 domain-containing protein [Gammaproteobacteria bacterium]
MKKLLASLLPALFLLAACSSGDNSAQQQATALSRIELKQLEVEKLHKIFDDYWEKQMELSPIFATFIGDNRYNDRLANSIGPEAIAENERVEREYLAKINAIDPTLLEGQDRLSYDMFVYNREQAIEGLDFPGELLPISQFFSMPNFVASLGSGKSLHPFKTVKDYQDWLSRIDGFVVWMDQSITNMKRGVEESVVQPRILMDKALPQLAAHVIDDPEQSVFWGPISNFPEEFSDEDKTRLTEAYRTAITEQIVPAYQRVHDYIAQEYLPETRETVGMNGLPNGAAWYAYNAKQITTTDLSPADIHAIGKTEVARIHDEMLGVMKEVGFEGDLKAFFEFMNTDPQFYYEDKEELLTGYRELKDRVNALTPKLFNMMPKADYEVVAVEPFREQSAAGAFYMGASPDGSRPGRFYVNTYEMSSRPIWAMESLSLHEAAPGHHFQGSLTLELTDLPKFRQFGGFTAYSEGWGLYAESLGKELGVYTDPYQYFGALNAELWRAIRLVVDTGLHYHGWSRDDVLNYMYENSAVKEVRAVAEAERYMAIPGQALGYKIGQLKIQELRKRAADALGENFDVGEFHDQVLLDGELPLDTLEKKIDRWIASK